jgi:thiosulfate/3-mercaptopyruvate sulfurtransferase
MRVALVLAFLLAVSTGPLEAQWPPWLKKTPSRPPHYPEIAVTAEWLAAHASQPGFVVLDARGPSSYLAGHVPSAISLPADSLAPEADPGGLFGLRGLSGEERVVVCADSASIEDGAYLFWLLETAGARDVRFLDGGFESWLRSGRPAETISAARESARWTERPDASRRATKEQVTAAYGLPGMEIVDARGEQEWEGGPAGAKASAGHIPHSLPYDFRQMILADGTFRAPSEMRAMFSRLGPRPSDLVDIDGRFIVHGRGPSDAGALGYLALRMAGVDSVRYDPGGWDEWVADTTLPVVRIPRAEELQDRLRSEPFRFAADKPPAGFVFFDVRFRLDFQAPGHIPGAVNLASNVFGDSLDVYLARHWPGVDRARVPMVVYCYGPDCIRSRICTTIAARQGFRRLEWFRGGLEEWRALGGEIVGSER